MPSWREAIFVIEPDLGFIVYRHPYVQMPPSQYVTSFDVNLRSVVYTGVVPDDFQEFLEGFRVIFDTASWKPVKTPEISSEQKTRFKMLYECCRTLKIAETAVNNKRASYEKNLAGVDKFHGLLERAFQKVEAEEPLSNNEKLAIELYGREHGSTGVKNTLALYKFKKEEYEHMLLLTEEHLLDLRDLLRAAKTIDDVTNARNHALTRLTA